MDCFGTCFTHVRTCNVTRVHSATEWTASVHALHMSKPVMQRVFTVLRNGLLRNALKKRPAPARPYGTMDRCFFFTAASCRLSCPFVLRRLHADCLVICFYGGFVPTVLNCHLFSRRLRAGCLFGRRLRADCLVVTAASCRLFVWTAASCRLSCCYGGFAPTVVLSRRLRADCLVVTAASCRLSCSSRRLRADCLDFCTAASRRLSWFEMRRLCADCLGLRYGGFAPTVSFFLRRLLASVLV